MKFRTAATALSGALLSAALVPAPAAADQTCRSDGEVGQMIAAFVADLRDDVRSRKARGAVKKALVESMETFRGEKAETAAERQAIGEEIATLARRQSETGNRLEGEALAAAIKALVEQRERGSFTAAERKDLRGAIADVKRMLVNRGDSEAERRQIADDIRAIVQQYTCA